MGNLAKTISYCKRNGVINTWYAVRERTDRTHFDADSKRAVCYQGRKKLTDAIKKEQRMRIFSKSYRFSILVPAYETDVVFLREMIASVLAQTYENWELVIADASQSETVQKTVKSYKDQRICYHKLKKNGGISENTNQALQFAKGDYIGLLDHDDVLTEDALYEIMVKLEEEEYCILYSDEDKADGSLLKFYEPHFKPEFNLDLLLSNNYICHFLVMKRELIQKLGFRKERDGAQDYDLLLRAVCEIWKAAMKQDAGAKQNVKQVFAPTIAHIPKVLYHWRCHEASTAANPESKRYAYKAGLLALADFIKEMGWQATVSHSLHLGFYELRYEKPVWEVRQDIAAIGGRVIKKGVVVSSPKLAGKVIFRGLRKQYSGYMHRADLYLDVDELDARCLKKRPGLTMSLKEAKQAGMLFLYDPSFLVKDEKNQGEKSRYAKDNSCDTKL